MRVTEKMLNELVAELNGKAGDPHRYVLTSGPGGYGLQHPGPVALDLGITNSARFNGRELYWFLVGVLNGMDESPRAKNLAPLAIAAVKIRNLLHGRDPYPEMLGEVAGLLAGVGLNVAVPEDCDCDKRSWVGPVHDSACPLAGLKRGF